MERRKGGGKQECRLWSPLKAEAATQLWDVSVERAALLTTQCLTTTQREWLSEPRASRVTVVPPIITTLEGTHFQKQDWLSALYLGTVTRKMYLNRHHWPLLWFTGILWIFPVCFISSQSLEDVTMLYSRDDRLHRCPAAHHSPTWVWGVHRKKQNLSLLSFKRTTDYLKDRLYYDWLKCVLCS